MASNLLAMGSNLVGLQPTNLLAVASNLLGMASQPSCAGLQPSCEWPSISRLRVADVPVAEVLLDELTVNADAETEVWSWTESFHSTSLLTCTWSRHAGFSC